MWSLSFIFGLLGNVTTGLIYLASIPTFWRLLKRRSTEEFESLPYISKLLNAYFWTYYGVIKPNSVVIATVNGFGAILEIAYVVIFLLYAPPPMKANTAILAGVLNVGFPAAVVVAAHSLLECDMQIRVAGLMSAVFSMVAYGSPLSAMKTVMTTKSVEYMPFLLSFILFINGAVWVIYAILTKDLFVGIPNGTGFILGAAQLILYAIYYESEKSKIVFAGELEEDGWQHESLIREADNKKGLQEK